MKRSWDAFVSLICAAMCFPTIDANAQATTATRPQVVRSIGPACIASDDDYPSCLGNDRIATALAKIYFENYIRAAKTPSTVKLLLPSNLTVRQEERYLRRLEHRALAIAVDNMRREVWMHGEMGGPNDAGKQSLADDDLDRINRWAMRMTRRIDTGNVSWQVSEGQAQYKLVETQSEELREMSVCSPENQWYGLSTCTGEFPRTGQFPRWR
jgi:hypothetical protein